MEEIDFTPPFVIPVAILLAVFATAFFREPDKAPDSYVLTISVPKETYDALTRKATGYMPVQAIAAQIVTEAVRP